MHLIYFEIIKLFKDRLFVGFGFLLLRHQFYPIFIPVLSQFYPILLEASRNISKHS